MYKVHDVHVFFSTNINQQSKKPTARQLISHCPDILELPTLCGSSITGLASSASQIASWGSQIAIACGESGSAAHPNKKSPTGAGWRWHGEDGKRCVFFSPYFFQFFFVMLSYAGVSRWGNWWNLWMGQISDFFGGHDGRWEMIRSTKMGRFLEREFRTKSFNMKFKR